MGARWVVATQPTLNKRVCPQVNISNAADWCHRQLRGTAKNHGDDYSIRWRLFAKVKCFALVCCAVGKHLSNTQLKMHQWSSLLLNCLFCSGGDRCKSSGVLLRSYKTGSVRFVNKAIICHKNSSSVKVMTLTYVTSRNHELVSTGFASQLKCENLMFSWNFAKNTRFISERKRRFLISRILFILSITSLSEFKASNGTALSWGESRKNFCTMGQWKSYTTPYSHDKAS